MPHLTLWHTPNIKTDFDVLCRALCDTLLRIRDEDGKQVYPVGGTRVMAFPATAFAVADGKRDYAFMYMNLRIFGGRSGDVTKRTGDALLEVIGRLMEPNLSKEAIGITLQIDETPKEMPDALLQVYEDRHNTIHRLFKK